MDGVDAVLPTQQALLEDKLCRDSTGHKSTALPGDGYSAIVHDLTAVSGHPAST